MRQVIMEIQPQDSKTTVMRTKAKRYYAVSSKFWLSHLLALLWCLLSIWLSVSWVEELGQYVTKIGAYLIIAGIAYIPGYMNAFMVFSLLLDRQPAFKNINPTEAVTVLIACYNEEKSLGETLRYILNQDYEGDIRIIVIDNNSQDNTAGIARMNRLLSGKDIQVIFEATPGKHHALNAALPYVRTEYVITVDADTLLHRSALRFLMARFLSAPHDVCAVAGAVLVRNSRKNIWTQIQEWDYFLGIANIKRLQGLYQSTLVAQGAFSVYRTAVVRQVKGWPNAIGEDIVLTWNMLAHGWRVYFEPLAVAFTDVPENFTHFMRQRNRWARGMIEALRVVKPWQQQRMFTRYLTGNNLIMPYLDIVYTFCWLPGLVAAFFGHYWIVGPVTLFVIPLALLQNYILYRYQRTVFKQLNLKIRQNTIGFILFVLVYQMIMSPVSVWGYFQEFFRTKRVWK